MLEGKPPAETSQPLASENMRLKGKQLAEASRRLPQKQNCRKQINPNPKHHIVTPRVLQSHRLYPKP
eukprot:10839654-Heterocapsa_arctica.AAC.1